MDTPPTVPRNVGPTRLPKEDTEEWTLVDEGLCEALEIWRDVCEKRRG